MKFNYLICSLFFTVLSVNAANLPASTNHDSVETWLTFDACGGGFDWNIANFLVKNEIKSSIFLTSIWINKNPTAVIFLKSYPQFFKIENHGKNHHAAVLSANQVYNVQTVLNEPGLKEEVFTAQKEIENVFGVSPIWFRGATALYDEKSLKWLKESKVNIAGYTIAVDSGATANEYQIYKNFKKAKKGDILLELIKNLKPDWS